MTDTPNPQAPPPAGDLKALFDEVDALGDKISVMSYEELRAFREMVDKQLRGRDNLVHTQAPPPDELAAIAERRAATIQAEALYQSWRKLMKQFPQTPESEAEKLRLETAWTEAARRGYPDNHDYAPEVDRLLAEVERLTGENNELAAIATRVKRQDERVLSLSVELARARGIIRKFSQCQILSSFQQMVELADRYLYPEAYVEDTRHDATD